MVMATPAGAIAESLDSDVPLWLGEGDLRSAEYRELILQRPPILHGNENRSAYIGPWSELAASIFWTEAVLDLIKKYQQNPLRAARALSYTNIAIDDAMAISRRRGLGAGGMQVSAHAAASLVVQYLFPEETFARFEAIARASYLAIRDEPAVPDARMAGWRIGTAVAHAAISRAAIDGAAAVWKVEDQPPLAIGKWRASPPINSSNPTEALAGRWRTWVAEEASRDFAPLPIAYDSAAYWEEAQEVLDVTLKLTAEQKTIAERWNLDLGTVTPAGVWNLIAIDAARSRGMDEVRSARLFSTLNAAMHDAFIACWKVKYTHWTERPVTAIRRRFDPRFLPHILTPAFPSFPSGHATVSGAASEVLAGFFPEDVSTLRAQAEEAAQSRLYGGIHFRSDNERGLAFGQAIGRRSLAHAKGKTEDGLR